LTKGEPNTGELKKAAKLAACGGSADTKGKESRRGSIDWHLGSFKKRNKGGDRRPYDPTGS